MGRNKHVPQRTCIICRTIKPKRELLRVVRTPEQTLYLDNTGKAPGRGAYLCRDRLCWQHKELSRKQVAHALKMGISQEDWDLLITSLI